MEAALHFRDPAKIDAVLAELGLPECADGQLLLKRSLAREKPPRITVNGSLATLAGLQRLGELWIDFHGPSEPRRLLRADCQLDLLDLFGRAGEVRAGYTAAYRTWRGASRGARGSLRAGPGWSPDQVEFLRAPPGADRGGGPGAGRRSRPSSASCSRLGRGAGAARIDRRPGGRPHRGGRPADPHRRPAARGPAAGAAGSGEPGPWPSA